MAMLRNIFACLVHENTDCVIDLVRNLHFLDPPPLSCCTTAVVSRICSRPGSHSSGIERSCIPRPDQCHGGAFMTLLWIACSSRWINCRSIRSRSWILTSWEYAPAIRNIWPFSCGTQWDRAV
jgi:hypothetical protein